MAEERQKNGRRYGIAAACGVLVLAVIVGAYWLGRSAGAGEDVGEAAAKSAALGHAGVAESELSRYEIAREDRDGGPVYAVKFTVDGTEYGYEINAADGGIVKFSREAKETAPMEPVGDAPADGGIGEARAWEIAYGHAGVAAEEASASPVKLDYDDGTLVYELEFFAGGYEYDYEISAADGSVVKFEREAGTGSAPPQTPPENSGAVPAAPIQPTAGDTPGAPAKTPASSGGIGEVRAKEIALAHAGVTADSVTGYRWELDYEDGVQVYELEFFAGGYEYDYEISAADGSVVKFKKEIDGTRPVQSGGSADPVYIGEARAREIAYGHAGLAAADVARCAVEMDHHDGHHSGHHGSGCCEYEIDFWCGGYEYEYKVDAVTGEILESGRELDD